jgi:hypothetical protein
MKNMAASRREVQVSSPAHIEFVLQFLIARCGITAPLAIRRLNGFENTLAALAWRWRQEHDLGPATELRLSVETRHDLFDWLGVDPWGTAPHHERLGPYLDGGPVLDEGVPPGWVRVLVGGASAVRCG